MQTDNTLGSKGGPSSTIPGDVAELFIKLALQVKQAGHRRYSADAILHRIRWHMQIEKGKREFKCNNNWTSTLARWAMKERPELRGFFATRETK